MPPQTDALSPTLLRKVWFTIDTTASSSLLGLSDTQLAQQLAERLEYSDCLTPQESSEVKQYICARANLIRDVVRQ